jgi:hypothetical protein
MTTPERDDPLAGFLPGLIWKTLALGAAAGLLVARWMSSGLGWSVMAGAGLAAANAAALSWLVGKILEPEPDETAEIRKSTAFWAALLGFKLLALLTLAFLVIVLFGVRPLGLAIGYTMFLLATIWQTTAAYGGRTRRPDDTRDGPDDRH